MRLITVFSNEDLNKLRYQILVELWERNIGTNKYSGSKSFKRKYEKEFTEKERKIISKYYNIFKHWYIDINSAGTPCEYEMTIADYQLIQRAVAFFAMN